MEEKVRTAIIIGSGSDIGKELRIRLLNDGWAVIGPPRGYVDGARWDMLIICIGSMKPIGRLLDVSVARWEEGVLVNAFLPLREFRKRYPYRNQNARVFFFDGPNLSKPTPTYSAYRAGKAILAAIVPTLQAECPDIKFTLLHTGAVKTKIHYQTIDANASAEDVSRAARILAGEEKTTSHDEVYEMIK